MGISPVHLGLGDEVSSLGLRYWQLLAASHTVVGFLNCTWLLSWVPGGRTPAFKFGKHLKTDTISLAPHLIVLMKIPQLY